MPAALRTSNNVTSTGAAGLNVNGGNLVNAGVVINPDAFINQALTLTGIVHPNVNGGNLANTGANINLGFAIPVAQPQAAVLTVNGAMGNHHQGQMNIHMTPGATINFGPNAVIGTQLNITDDNGNHMTINPGTNVTTIRSVNGQLQVTYKLDLKGPLCSLDFFNHHHHDQDPDGGANGFGVLVGEAPMTSMVEAY